MWALSFLCENKKFIPTFWWVSKTFEQFEFDGCENCEEFLRMKNNKDNIYDCTSSNYDGWVLLIF